MYQCIYVEQFWSLGHDGVQVPGTWFQGTVLVPGVIHTSTDKNRFFICPLLYDRRYFCVHYLLSTIASIRKWLAVVVGVCPSLIAKTDDTRT